MNRKIVNTQHHSKLVKKLMIKSITFNIFNHGYQIEIRIVNQKGYFMNRESNHIMNHKIHYE